MKRFVVFALLVMAVTLTASAQSGQDFAARFLALYGEKYELQCNTISPQMMERILQLDDVESNEQTQRLVSQLKSIRILTGGASKVEATALFEKAEALASRNKRRYAVHASQEGQSVYTRRHGKKLVEIVLVMLRDDGMFYMTDLTGNLSDDFINQLLKIQ